jgi:hypothetical protein
MVPEKRSFTNFPAIESYPVIFHFFAAPPGQNPLILPQINQPQQMAQHIPLIEQKKSQAYQLLDRLSKMGDSSSFLGQMTSLNDQNAVYKQLFQNNKPAEEEDSVHIDDVEIKSISNTEAKSARRLSDVNIAGRRLSD